jgi:hypothetical protein
MLRKLLHRKGWVKVQDLDECVGDGSPGQTVSMLRSASREMYWFGTDKLADHLRDLAREIEKGDASGDR